MRRYIDISKKIKIFFYFHYFNELLRDVISNIELWVYCILCEIQEYSETRIKQTLGFNAQSLHLQMIVFYIHQLCNNKLWDICIWYVKRCSLSPNLTILNLNRNRLPLVTTATGHLALKWSRGSRQNISMGPNQQIEGKK